MLGLRCAQAQAYAILVLLGSSSLLHRKQVSKWSSYTTFMVGHVCCCRAGCLWRRMAGEARWKHRWAWVTGSPMSPTSASCPSVHPSGRRWGGKLRGQAQRASTVVIICAPIWEEVRGQAQSTHTPVAVWAWGGRGGGSGSCSDGDMTVKVTSDMVMMVTSDMGWCLRHGYDGDLIHGMMAFPYLHCVCACTPACGHALLCILLCCCSWILLPCIQQEGLVNREPWSFSVGFQF